jgi:hypothetical protein
LCNDGARQATITALWTTCRSGTVGVIAITSLADATTVGDNLLPKRSGSEANPEAGYIALVLRPPTAGAMLAVPVLSCSGG